MRLVTIYANGRIMLPAEIRRRLNIKAGDSLAFFISQDDEIILRRACWGTYNF